MAGKYSLTLQLQLQSPQNVAQVVKQLQNQLGAVAVNVQVKNAAKATQQVNQLATATNNASNAAAKMGDAFGVSLKRFAAFSLASRAIGVFTRGLAGAIDSAIDFQNELVKISQITGENLNDLGKLTKEITSLATEFGVASNEILGVTNILAQAGIKANDLTIAIRTLTKTKLAPTFGDIQDTAEGAVALIAQFEQGVGALERQLGAVNRVAAEFAVESQDLIEVIRRTGGVFKASGGDLEELLALFTSVRATTRESAESIATALKTIFTRIQRPETIQYLRQFGIELVDLNGKFVGPYEAVRRLSQELSSLGEGDIRFISIAEELGGYRQIGKVIPLLRQFETAERARQVALEAGNSLNEDAAKAQQSLAVQFTKTREKFLALIRGISETSSFQLLVKTSLNLANALISVADALKPIIPLVATLAAVKFGANIGSFFGSVGAAFTRKQFGGPIQKFASGGMVPGSGNRDTVPAMLTPGEFVIRKSSVKKLGAGRLAAMNNNKYATGGVVELSPTKSYVRSKLDTFDKDESTSIKDALNNKERSLRFNLKDTISANIERKPIKISERWKRLPSYGRYQTALQTSDYKERGNAFEQLLAENKFFSKDKTSKYSRLDGLRGDRPVEVKSEKKQVSAKTILTKLAGAMVYEDSATDKIVAEKAKKKKLTSRPNKIDFGNVLLYEDITPIKKAGNKYNQKFEIDRKAEIPNIPNPLSRKEKLRIPRKFFGGTIQKFGLGSKVSQATRRVGYIDSDVIADPANADVVSAEMKKLGITNIPDYMMYLSKMAATARKTGEIGRYRVVAAVAGAGKSNLLLGGQNNPKIKDDASLRNTSRFPILRPSDISKATEIIGATATVTQEKLDNFITAADKVYVLSSTTKEEREEVKRRRGIRNTTGVNLFGRNPGTTDSAPTDSAEMEAMLGASVSQSKLRILGIQKDKRAKIKRENEQIEVLKKKIGLFYGSFSPTTIGHQSMMDAATAMGISPEDFLVLVGSNESLNTKDPHSFRTAVFDQDFRALLAKAGFGARGAMVSKKGRKDFGIPKAMEVEAGASGRRRFVVAQAGSTALVAGKDDKASKKYTDAGYKVQDVPRDEGNVSGSLARDAILSGNVAEMKRLLSPEVFDVVQKNLAQLKNRAETLPKIIESVRRKEVASLSEIEEKLAVLPARIDKKKVASDPEYAKLAEQVTELRKRRDKIKSIAEFKPFKLIDKLAKRYPEKYGLKRFATGGMVPGTGNRDTVPAMLTPGEFVIRKSSVAKIGAQNLAAMNRGGTVQKFELGGEALEELAAKTRMEVAGKRDTDRFRGKAGDKISRMPLKFEADTKDLYGGAFLSPEGDVQDLAGTINSTEFLNKITKSANPKDTNLRIIKAQWQKLDDSQKNDIKSYADKSLDYNIAAASLEKDFAEKIENKIYEGVLKSIQEGGSELAKETKIAQSNFSAGTAANILRKTNIDNVTGNIFQAMLENASPYDDKGDKDSTWDFPAGLKSTKFNDNRLSNIPTDAKTRFTNYNISSLEDKVKATEAKKVSGMIAKALEPVSKSPSSPTPLQQPSRIGIDESTKAKILNAASAGPISLKQIRNLVGNPTLAPGLLSSFLQPEKPEKIKATTRFIKKMASGGIVQKFSEGSLVEQVKNDSILLSLLQSSPPTLPISTMLKMQGIGNYLKNIESVYKVPANSKLIGSGQESAVFDIGKRILKISPTSAFDLPRMRGVASYFKVEKFGPLNAALQQKLTTGKNANINQEDVEKAQQKIRSQGTEENYNEWRDPKEENLGRDKNGRIKIIDGPVKQPYHQIWSKIRNSLGFAKGGAAPSDTVPALLTPGEFVFSKKSAQRIGYGTLNRMNKKGVTGYAKGGPVAVKKFGTGGKATGGGATGGGQDGFSLFNDRMFQASIGLSTLTGMLGNTETAFGRMVNYLGSFGTAVTSTITLLNAFGATNLIASSTALSKAFANIKPNSFKEFKQLFGTGKKSIGAKVFGLERDATGKTKTIIRESFSAGFDRGQDDNILKERRKQLGKVKSADKRIEKQQAEFDALGGFGKRKENRLAALSTSASKSARQSTISSLGSKSNLTKNEEKRLADARAEKQEFADLKRARDLKQKIKQNKDKRKAAQKEVDKRSSTSIFGNIGESLSTFAKKNAGKSGITGFLAKTTQSLGTKFAASGLGGAGVTAAGSATAAGGLAATLAAATGPIAAIVTGLTVLNGVVGAAIDTQGRYTKAVEKGDVANAQFYASLKEAPSLIAAFDLALTNITGGLFGNLSPLSDTFNYLNSFIGGPTLTSLKENAKAQALSARYTEESAKVQERISTLLNDLQAGTATKSATQALSERGASSVGYGRELTAQIEQSTLTAQSSELGNRTTGLISYGLRSTIASLGGGLFGMETSYTRNTRIEAEARKQSTEAINKNREAFQQLFPLITKSAQEYIIAGKGADEFINKMLAEGKIRKLDERSKTRLTNLREERNTELAAGRSLSAEKEIELKALEAIDQEFESTLKMFKQQEKAIEENRKYIESLSFGFRNINSAAQATSLGLEMLAGSVETGFNAFDNAAKQLEAALSNVGQSMNPEDVQNAMGTLAQTLAGYGASQQEIDRATSSFGALYTAQTEAQGALESLKTTMLQNPTGVAPEQLKETFKTELSSRLQAQGVAQPEINRIVNSLNGLDLSSTEVLNKIKSGDLGAFTEEAFAPLREALTKETLGPLQERAKQESVLINLTKQRIDLEKAAIDARKQAIDIELEARKAIEEFGGPVVKSSQKLKALNDKLNLNLGSVGVRGLRTGASTELADAQAAIRSGFNSLQRRQNTAVALNGTGAFAGAAGMNEDRRQQLEEAQQSLIEYSRQRLDLIREEIEIAKKKNELEKSAAEKLISGDIEGFIQSQQAAAAASILRTGDEALAKLFSPTALGEAFKSLEGQGLTSAQMQSAARTALSPVGGTTRMSQVLTGTTPELEALKAEGRNVANVLGEAGKGFADMQQMKVTAQEVVITAAQVKMGEQMNVAPSQSNLTQNPIMGFMKGGVVYANRGIFVPRGTDTVPAMLSPGEFVVNAKSAQQNLGLLSAINGGAQTLSKGGIVYAQQGGFNAAPGVKTYTRDGEEWYNNNAYQMAKMGLSFAGPLSILSDFMDIGEGVYDISEGKLGKGLGKIAMGGTFALINALTGGFGGGLLKAGLKGGIGAAKFGRRSLGALKGTKLAKGIGSKFGKIGDIGANIAGRFKDAQKAKTLAKIDKLGLGDKQKAMLIENMFGGGRAARKGRADATKFMDTMAARKTASTAVAKKPTKAPTQTQIDEAFRVYSGKNKKGVFTGSYIDARNKKAYSAAGKELTGASASSVMKSAVENQKQGIRFTSKGTSLRKQSDGTMLGFNKAGTPMNSSASNNIQKTFMERSKIRKASGQLTQNQARQAARQQKMGKLLDEADAEEAAKMAKMADAEALVKNQTGGGGIMSKIKNFANSAQPTTRAGRMRSVANAVGGGLIRTGARSMFGTAPGVSSIGLDQSVTAAGLEQEMKDRGIVGGTTATAAPLSRRPPVQSRPMLKMPQVSARDIASRPMLSPLQQSQGILSSAMRRDAARSAGAIAGGGGAGGISSETVAMLTSAFDSFAESVQTLQSMQISVKLDATNINVNFNGASFLDNLTTEVKNGVLAQVVNKIENELMIDNVGKPKFQTGGMV